MLQNMEYKYKSCPAQVNRAGPLALLSSRYRPMLGVGLTSNRLIEGGDNLLDRLPLVVVRIPIIGTRQFDGRLDPLGRKILTKKTTVGGRVGEKQHQ